MVFFQVVAAIIVTLWIPIVVIVFVRANRSEDCIDSKQSEQEGKS